MVISLLVVRDQPGAPLPLRIADDVLAAGGIAVLLGEAIERTVATQGVDAEAHLVAEARAEAFSEALGLLLKEDATELRARLLAKILERRCRDADGLAICRRILRGER